MNKETLLKAGIVTTITAGLVYFSYRFVKEMKCQVSEIQEQAEAEKEELRATIKLRDEQLALAEEHIDALVFGTPEEDPNAPYAEVNKELEEMRHERKRVSSIIPEDELAPTDEEDYHTGSQQTAEEVEHHNVWKENEYFNSGETNIPYFVIESAKDLKGNEGQSIIDVFSELLEVNDTKIVQPYNAFDNNVWEDVYERRIDFFGPDTYYSSLQFPVTFGEILYEYATKFVEDTEDGALLPMVAYMLYESGLLEAETIEQRLLIINKILEHRNVREIGNGMKKLSMFGRVVDKLSPEDTGHDIRLYTEYNEFIGRASSFEEEYMAQFGDEDE